MGGSSSRSAWETSSSTVPATSARRVVDPKKRKRTLSPTTTPSSISGSDAFEPSSIPSGATHSAVRGGSIPGTAGAELSMPT
jgi:hypothetical protein